MGEDLNFFGITSLWTISKLSKSIKNTFELSVPTANNFALFDQHKQEN